MGGYPAKLTTLLRLGAANLGGNNLLALLNTPRLQDIKNAKWVSLHPKNAKWLSLHPNHGLSSRCGAWVEACSWKMIAQLFGREVPG